MAKKDFQIYHTRIKRTTNIIAIRSDKYNPMTLIVDFEHELPDNYYKNATEIDFAFYTDREFVKEFFENSNKLQLRTVDAVSILEVFAHPHSGFRFIRAPESPGNKIVIRFRSKDPNLVDNFLHRIFWDAGSGTIIESPVGEVDAFSGLASGSRIRSGRLVGPE